MAFIYDLFDPANQVVFYVGQTENPPSRYFDGHLRFDRRNAGKLRQHWIYHLLEMGVYPQIRRLEEVTWKFEIRSREAYWIVYRLAEGCPLANGQFNCCLQWGLTPQRAQLIARRNLVEHAHYSPDFTLAELVLRRWGALFDVPQIGES